MSVFRSAASSKYQDVFQSTINSVGDRGLVDDVAIDYWFIKKLMKKYARFGYISPTLSVHMGSTTSWTFMNTDNYTTQSIVREFKNNDLVFVPYNAGRESKESFEERLARSTSKENPPVRINGNHWILFAFIVNKGAITDSALFESLSHRDYRLAVNNEIYRKMLKTIKTAFNVFGSTVNDNFEKDMKVPDTIPQTNGYDCGVIICKYAEKILETGKGMSVSEINPNPTFIIDSRKEILRVIQGRESKSNITIANIYNKSRIQGVSQPILHEFMRRLRMQEEIDAEKRSQSKKNDPVGVEDLTSPNRTGPDIDSNNDTKSDQPMATEQESESDKNGIGSFTTVDSSVPRTPRTLKSIKKTMEIIREENKEVVGLLGTWIKKLSRANSDYDKNQKEHIRDLLESLKSGNLSYDDPLIILQLKRIVEQYNKYVSGVDAEKFKKAPQYMKQMASEESRSYIEEVVSYIYINDTDTTNPDVEIITTPDFLKTVAKRPHDNSPLPEEEEELRVRVERRISEKNKKQNDQIGGEAGNASPLAVSGSVASNATPAGTAQQAELNLEPHKLNMDDEDEDENKEEGEQQEEKDGDNPPPYEEKDGDNPPQYDNPYKFFDPPPSYEDATLQPPYEENPPPYEENSSSAEVVGTSDRRKKKSKDEEGAYEGGQPIDPGPQNSANTERDEGRSNQVDYEYSSTAVDVGMMGLSTTYADYIVLHREATRFFFNFMDFNDLTALYVDGDHMKLTHKGKEKYDALEGQNFFKFAYNIVRKYETVFGISAPKFNQSSKRLDQFWEYNELCQLVVAYNRYANTTAGMYPHKGGASGGGGGGGANGDAGGASGGLTGTSYSISTDKGTGVTSQNLSGALVNRQTMSGLSAAMGLSTQGSLNASKQRSVYDGQGRPTSEVPGKDNRLVDPSPILSKYSKIATGDEGVNSGKIFRKLNLNSQGVDFLDPAAHYTGPPLSGNANMIRKVLGTPGPQYLRNPINPTRTFTY